MGRHTRRNTSPERRLSGRGLTCAGLNNLPHDDFIDLSGRYTSATHSLGNDQGTKLGSAMIG
jgi:hypothetical protein